MNFLKTIYDTEGPLGLPMKDKQARLLDGILKTLPEEDRQLYMPNAPWHGGYRWFRSPNVICLEKCRLLKGQVGKRG